MCSPVKFGLFALSCYQCNVIERPPNIRHLAAFIATVEHGTATRAAEVAGLTQPALTQAIARLENDLACQLFDREPSGMSPTAPARQLAPRVARAIELIGSPRVTSAQIRAFQALARAGSYSVASSLTGVSASSLHRAVNDLSLTLGETLVERRGRQVALTARGEARAQSFGLALAELRAGLSEIAATQGEAAGRIMIGATPISRALWLPRSILLFAERFPGMEISMTEGSRRELVGPLRHGEIDFLLGQVQEDDDLDDLVEEPVFEDEPQLIMRPGHPLVGSGEVALEQLGDYPWVLPPALSPLRVCWEDMMDQAGATPHVAVECGSVLTIRELLLDTDSLSLLSPDQLRVELEAGLLVTVEPPFPMQRTIGITTRADWHPSATQIALLDILRQVAADEMGGTAA